MVVKAPQVARKGAAGQFVIVRIDEVGERIPLTIADYDRAAETITLIFQEVGKSTIQMGTLEVGDEFVTVMGPLGHPTDIENYGTVVCMGGGVCSTNGAAGSRVRRLRYWLWNTARSIPNRSCSWWRYPSS